MDVLIVAQSVGAVGGIERMTGLLCEALGEDKCTVMAAERWRKRNASKPQLAAARLRFAVAVIATAARRRHAQRVVLCTHINLAPVAALAAAISGSSFAVWVHGIEVWREPLPLLYRWSLAKADRVWAGSEFTLNRVRAIEGVVAGSVVLHGYGLKFDAGAQPRRTRPLAVLCVARTSRHDAYKGVDQLIRAWPHVVRRLPSAQLRIVGDGDDLARLQALAERTRVSPSIVFRGEVTDEELENEYRTARLFCLPGRASFGRWPEGEGFGLVFIEAAARGALPVAGAAAGAPEAVGDPRLLVDPYDPEAIARSLVDFMTDEARAAELASVAIERARSLFSFEPFAARSRELVRELLAARDG